MARYVLLPRSRHVSPEARKRLVDQAGIEVVDETAGRAFLVDATDEAVAGLRKALPDWIISPEILHPRPSRPMQQVSRRS